VSDSGDRDRQVGQQLERFGLADDLLLDARGREQQIDDWWLRRVQPTESHGGQTPDGLLLDDGLDRVTSSAQHVNEGLCFGVAREWHCKIGVPRESRLGASGHGKPADKS
jgi:hypothetical protein